MYFINKENVVVYRDEKHKKDMAFLQFDKIVFDEFLDKPVEVHIKGADAIAHLLDYFCDEYVFKDTDIYFFDSPKIMKKVDWLYPEDYKGLKGVAWWEEEDYVDNLARVRLYRKVHKMTKRFAQELLDFIRERKEQTVNNVSEKKLQTIREYYYNKIHYEVDEDKKVVRAFFGKNIDDSRDKFARLAIHILNASFLKTNNDIYKESVKFLPEHFFTRNFVGVAKYNQEAELETFSAEKGKAIAREKLIKQYLRFEYVVGRYNFRKYLDDMELVEKRLETFI